MKLVWFSGTAGEPNFCSQTEWHQQLWYKFTLFDPADRTSLRPGPDAFTDLHTHIVHTFEKSRELYWDIEMTHVQFYLKSVQTPDSNLCPPYHPHTITQCTGFHKNILVIFSLQVLWPLFCFGRWLYKCNTSTGNYIYIKKFQLWVFRRPPKHIFSFGCVTWPIAFLTGLKSVGRFWRNVMSHTAVHQSGFNNI